MEGPRGSFGDLEGSGRSWGGSEVAQGGIEGVPGRFWRSPGGPLKKVTFFFWWGEFVNFLMKYLCFQFCVVLWSGWWSLDYVAFYCFSNVCSRNIEVNML